MKNGSGCGFQQRRWRRLPNVQSRPRSTVVIWVYLLADPSQEGNHGMPGQYMQNVSETSAALFLFVVDQSGSMYEAWGATNSPKKDQVADVINRTLDGLVAMLGRRANQELL
jgi:hypothetical protein